MPRLAVQQRAEHARRRRSSGTHSQPIRRPARRARPCGSSRGTRSRRSGGTATAPRRSARARSRRWRRSSSDRLRSRRGRPHPQGVMTPPGDRRTIGITTASPRPVYTAGPATGPADVLVVFGITGDLAKQMTLHSLYRLEARGLLTCPIVGVAVDDWTVDDLRERAREAIVASGEQLDPKVFERFAARLSYLAGDFADAATFARLADTLKEAHRPVFYLEIPPFLFSTVVKGLAEAGLTARRARRRREALRPRPRVGARARGQRCTSTSTSASSTGSTTTSGSSASRRSCSCASRTRSSSPSGTATTSRASRSRWPSTSASTTAGTSTTPSARCATSSSTT